MVSLEPSIPEPALLSPETLVERVHALTSLYVEGNKAQVSRAPGSRLYGYQGCEKQGVRRYSLIDDNGRERAIIELWQRIFTNGNAYQKKERLTLRMGLWTPLRDGGAIPPCRVIVACQAFDGLVYPPTRVEKTPWYTASHAKELGTLLPTESFLRPNLTVAVRAPEELFEVVAEETF